jgi:hypothetical protein
MGNCCAGVGSVDNIKDPYELDIEFKPVGLASVDAFLESLNGFMEPLQQLVNTVRLAINLQML